MMRKALSELGSRGGRASPLEKCCCRCYCFLVILVLVASGLFIAMGAMKDLTMDGNSTDWDQQWTFDSSGKGILALTLGCCVGGLACCLCCVPVCYAECASKEMRHAWGQECSKCTRCCSKCWCCCCCVVCFNCCDYYCCRRRGRSDSPQAPKERYVPRLDPYETPKMPDMVEMGQAATL
ncbi:unnamed protein product [Symbiodinium natans]|uniref:Uncharacterized protein n=1 Tax=Symbiodinium natans TaxID=878477 RepID=A0A812KKL7_9DINO|nr:unnamed protein product [Symbiodinium natans]